MSFLDGHAEAMTLEELGYEVLDRKLNQVEHDAGNNKYFNGLGYDVDETTGEAISGG